MHYLRNKQPLLFAPLNTSSLLLLMGCVVIRNNSQTPIEFDAETARYMDLAAMTCLSAMMVMTNYMLALALIF